MNNSIKKSIISILSVVLLLALNTACSIQNDKGKEDLKHSTSPDSITVEQSSGESATKTGDAGTTSTVENGKEAKYYPSSFSDFKTAYNENFDFWFDMPIDWKAFDRSENGDGYFIVSENSAMDIRVYGMYKTGTDEEFYSGLTGKNGSIEDYTFNDGVQGKKVLIAGSREYFVRPDVDTYICFYVNYENDSTWYEANTDKLNSIAASLRTRQEGPKLDTEENKISLDDLKLGEISIDMSYKDVMEIMKEEFLKEGTDEIGNKIIFYKDNTEIRIVEDTVYTMNVTSSKYATPRGLKVGDDEARVKELYGEPDNIEDETHLGYTYNGYELFSVVLKDGKVFELQIDMVQ